MHRRLSKILISIILLSFGVMASAQTVTNVRAVQKGNDIEVSFFLSKPASNVQLFVSMDGGKTFSAPLRMVSGAVGDVSSGYHTILWDVLSEYGSLVGDEIVFKVTVGQKNKAKTAPSTSHKVEKTNFFIEANIAPLPQMSWGVTVGFVKKVGVYARYLRNFGYADVNPKYSCYNNRYTTDFDYNASSVYSNRILTSGKAVIRRYAYCGGMMLNIAGRVYPYIGIGYGVRDLYYEDLNDDYAHVKDCSTHGFTLDAGLTLKLGPVALSAGALTTAFETTDVVLGIGFMF